MPRPPRSIVLIAAAAAFSLLGDQTLYAVLPTYYETLGLMPYQVGLILSVNRWVRLVTNHLAERLIQRFGVVLLLSAALTMGAGLTAVYALTNTFALLLTARILWGLCWSFIRQSGLMTVADASAPESIGRGMGFYNGLSRIGSLAGNFFGALGHDLLGFAGTLFLFSGVSLLGVPLGIFSQEDVKHARTDYSTEPLPLRRAVGLWASGFIVGCVGAGLLMSTLGHILKERAGTEFSFFGWTLGVATVTGALLSIRWLVDGLGAPFLGGLSDRIGRKRASLLFFLAGAGALAVGAATSDVLGMTISVTVFFACATAMTTIVAAEAGRRGSRGIAAYATANDMGSAFGPLLGWVTQQFSMPTPGIFLIGAGFYLLGAILSRRTFD